MPLANGQKITSGKSEWMPNDNSFKKSSYITLGGMADRFMEWKCHWNYPAQQFSTVPLEGPDPHG